jgi:hypothetical protein
MKQRHGTITPLLWINKLESSNLSRFHLYGFSNLIRIKFASTLFPQPLEKYIKHIYSKVLSSAVDFSMPGQKSKAEIIDERKANLPLPDDPPVAPDWSSADKRNVNATRGSKDSDVTTRAAAATSTTGLRGEPATEGSGIREEGGADLSGIGREGQEHLGGLPKDARKREE